MNDYVNDRTKCRPWLEKFAFIAKRLDIILQENALYDSNFYESLVRFVNFSLKLYKKFKKFTNSHKICRGLEEILEKIVRPRRVLNATLLITTFKFESNPVKDRLLYFGDADIIQI